MSSIFKIVLFLLFVGSITACSTLSVTKGRMLKTPVNFPYSKFDSIEKSKEYKIAVDDEIRLNMLANDGYNLALLGGASNVNGASGITGVSYKVRSDSTVKVPIIGKIKVVGLSMDSLEYLFESILSKQFQSPFVTAQISNRRIYVFSGISNASVFQLNNQNTTLFEVLANSGGIPGGGNASRIKIIRGDLKNPNIYLVNLSSIEGMKDANLIMQAGDVVYIEPFINYASIISTDIASLLSILTTGVLVYTLVK